MHLISTFSLKTLNINKTLYNTFYENLIILINNFEIERMSSLQLCFHLYKFVFKISSLNNCPFILIFFLIFFYKLHIAEIILYITH